MDTEGFWYDESDLQPELDSDQRNVLHSLKDNPAFELFIDRIVKVYTNIVMLKLAKASEMEEVKFFQGKIQALRSIPNLLDLALTRPDEEN